MAPDPRAASEKMVDNFADIVRSLTASDRAMVLERWKRSLYVLGAQDGMSGDAIDDWIQRVQSALSASP